jgi:hypothetical protein
LKHLTNILFLTIAIIFILWFLFHTSKHIEHETMTATGKNIITGQTIKLTWITDSNGTKILEREIIK